MTRYGPRRVARREELRGHLAMLLFSALVAGSFTFGVRAANLIDPAAITAARFVIAAGAVGGIILAKGRRLTARDFVAPWRYLVLGGLFGAYFVLMFEGLKTAPPVSASAVFTLTPLMAAGFGWLLMRQRISAAIALGLVLGACGALWIIFRGDAGALMRFDIGRGEGIYLIGCVAHALYAPMVPRLSRGEPALILGFGTLVGGGVLTMIWGWPAIRATGWSELPAIVWITLIYIALFASAMTVVLLQYAAMRLPSSRVMAYTYLTPVWVIAIEAALGQGMPDPIMLPGVIAVIAALSILLRTDGAQRAT